MAGGSACRSTASYAISLGCWPRTSRGGMCRNPDLSCMCWMPDEIVAGRAGMRLDQKLHP